MKTATHEFASSAGVHALAFAFSLLVSVVSAGAGQPGEPATAPGAASASPLPDRAEADPSKPGTPGQLRVLVVTGGHDFDPAFFKLFEGYPDLEYRKAGHDKDPEREANREYSAEKARAYDVLVLYDLHQEITEDARQDLQARVEEGKGLVVLRPVSPC